MIMSVFVMCAVKRSFMFTPSAEEVSVFVLLFDCVASGLDKLF